MSFNDALFVSAKGNNDRVHFWYISNDQTINRLKKSEKSGLL